MQNNDYVDMLASFGVHSAHPGGHDFSKRCLQQENITSESIILDAGCGLGETSQFLAKQYGCTISAVDIHAHMLEKAKQLASSDQPDVSFQMENVEELSFADNSFDFILSESTAAFTNIPKTLEQYYRVLKPGGILLAIEMTAVSTDQQMAQTYKDFYHLQHLFTKQEWCDALSNVGFADIQATFVPQASGFTKFSPDQAIGSHSYKQLHKHQEITEQTMKHIAGYYYRAKKPSHA